MIEEPTSDNSSLGFSYEHTNEYIYLDVALRSKWRTFIDFLDTYSSSGLLGSVELDQFMARKRRDLESKHLKIPRDAAEERINQIVKEAHARAFLLQVSLNEALMAEYVTTIMLAHALCEAIINSFLAIGLAKSGRPEIFHFIEKSGIKEKWRHGPKAFSPNYTLPKGTALEESLLELIKQRNTLAHYKIQLKIGGQKIFDGKSLDRRGARNSIDWIKRFFSLPYDLSDHLRRTVRTPKCMDLLESSPIERHKTHCAPELSGFASLFFLENDAPPTTGFGQD